MLYSIILFDYNLVEIGSFFGVDLEEIETWCKVFELEGSLLTRNRLMVDCLTECIDKAAVHHRHRGYDMEGIGSRVRIYDERMVVKRNDFIGMNSAVDGSEEHIAMMILREFEEHLSIIVGDGHTALVVVFSFYPEEHDAGAFVNGDDEAVLTSFFEGDLLLWRAIFESDFHGSPIPTIATTVAEFEVKITFVTKCDGRSSFDAMMSLELDIKS